MPLGRRRDDDRRGGFFSETARRFIRRLTCFAAIFLLAYLGFWFLNGIAGWIDNQYALNTLHIIRDIAIVAVVGLCGMEFVLRRRRPKLRFWLFIIYSVLLAGVIVLMLLFHADIRFAHDTLTGGV